MKEEMERPKITHVAIRFEGATYSLPAPNRHHDVIRFIIRTLDVEKVDAYDEDQGFLDETGRYLNRKQALLSARLNNQIRPGVTIKMNQLYSEDVW